MKPADISVAIRVTNSPSILRFTGQSNSVGERTGTGETGKMSGEKSHFSIVKQSGDRDETLWSGVVRKKNTAHESNYKFGEFNLVRGSGLARSQSSFKVYVAAMTTTFRKGTSSSTT